jgi:hypothetical protein
MHTMTTAISHLQPFCILEPHTTAPSSLLPASDRARAARLTTQLQLDHGPLQCPPASCSRQPAVGPGELGAKLARLRTRRWPTYAFRSCWSCAPICLPSPPRTRVPRAPNLPPGAEGSRRVARRARTVRSSPSPGEGRSFCPLPAEEGVREGLSLGLERTSQAIDTHQKVRLRDRGQWSRAPRHRADQGTVNTE